MKLSNIHKDQPGHPVSRATYWIDYILRHNGAKHLRATTYDIPTYQYFLVDIVLVIIVVAILAWYALYKIVKYVRRRRSAEHSATNGVCHNGLANGRHKKNGHIKHKEKVKWTMVS